MLAGRCAHDRSSCPTPKVAGSPRPTVRRTVAERSGFDLPRCTTATYRRDRRRQERTDHRPTARATGAGVARDGGMACSTALMRSTNAGSSSTTSGAWCSGQNRIVTCAITARIVPWPEQPVEVLDQPHERVTDHDLQCDRAARRYARRLRAASRSPRTDHPGKWWERHRSVPVRGATSQRSDTYGQCRRRPRRSHHRPVAGRRSLSHMVDGRCRWDAAGKRPDRSRARPARSRGPCWRVAGADERRGRSDLAAAVVFGGSGLGAQALTAEVLGDGHQ